MVQRVIGTTGNGFFAVFFTDVALRRQASSGTSV